MSTLTVARQRVHVSPWLLAALLAGAVLVRAAWTGPPGPGAGPLPSVFFGVVLATAAAAVGTRTSLRSRPLLVGVATGVVLVVPALAFAEVHGSLPLGAFPLWLGVTLLVAPAEEAFLRGVLFDAVARRHGVDVAIAVAAVLFGLLHVPYYGWHALPLDIVVGIVLGVARAVAGSWTAPAVAHSVADIAGWWML